jgi:peptidoglycan DL-endopeptidase CwlO
MATPRRLPRQLGRLALLALLSGGLALSATAPAMANPDEIPDAGSRPAPAGELSLPDGTATSLAGVLPEVLGPLAGEIAEAEAEIVRLVGQLRLLEPGLPDAQVETEAARTDWQAAQADRQDADEALRAIVDEAYRGAAAVLPQLTGIPLRDLAAHAPVPIDAPLGGEAAARKLLRAERAATQAWEHYQAVREAERDLRGQVDAVQTELSRQQASLERLRQRNADLLAQQEAAEQRRAAAGEFPLLGSKDGLQAHPLARQAVEFALRQLGKPYEWGAQGPHRYDCSGLMWDAYRSVGVNLPRVAADQYFGTRARPVARHALLPGDLVFFSRSPSDWRQVHHVGMYVGDGRMVHAPNRNDVVKVSPIWWGSYFGATRVVGAVESVDPSPTSSPSPTPSQSPTPSPPGTPTPSPSPTGTPSPSPTVTSVPDLSGRTAVEAVAAIEGSDLVPAEGEPVIEDCTVGLVAAQHPPPGTMVPVGSPVEFQMCVEPVAVPDVTQAHLSDAEAALADLDLVPEVVRIDSDRPVDEVLATDPTADTLVPPGSTVMLTVSRGNLLPELVGTTCGQALDLLRELGLDADLQLAEDAGTKAGAVVDQVPAAGEPHPEDGTVVLYVDALEDCDHEPEAEQPGTQHASQALGAAPTRMLLTGAGLQSGVLV